MTIGNRTVTQAINLSHDNAQLRAQVERLKATVKEQDETLGAQAKYSERIERELATLRKEIAAASARARANQISYEQYHALIERAATGEVIAEPVVMLWQENGKATEPSPSTDPAPRSNWDGADDDRR